jgi:hypothetical protein
MLKLKMLNIAMQDWHTSIVNMIEEGKAANEVFLHIKKPRHNGD